MEYLIPAASLQRIRAAYAQVEEVASIVSEALGIPSGTPRGLDIQRGVFIVEESLLAAEPPPPNGLAEVAV